MTDDPKGAPPRTKHDITKENEARKLRAAWWNTLATNAMVLGLGAPIATSMFHLSANEPQLLPGVFIWPMVSVVLHIVAQMELTELEDAG